MNISEGANQKYTSIVPAMLPRVAGFLSDQCNEGERLILLCQIKARKLRRSKWQSVTE